MGFGKELIIKKNGSKMKIKITNESKNTNSSNKVFIKSISIKNHRNVKVILRSQTHIEMQSNTQQLVSMRLINLQKSKF